GGYEQVTFVLAVVIVGHDHDLTLGEGGDDGLDALMGFDVHDVPTSVLALERPSRACAHLGALTQIVIRNHACHHGLADRHRPDAHARVVAALGADLGLVAVAVDGAPRVEDRRGRLDREAHHDRLTG